MSALNSNYSAYSGVTLPKISPLVLSRLLPNSFALARQPGGGYGKSPRNLAPNPVPVGTRLRPVSSNVGEATALKNGFQPQKGTSFVSDGRFIVRMPDKPLAGTQKRTGVVVGVDPRSGIDMLDILKGVVFTKRLDVNMPGATQIIPGYTISDFKRLLKANEELAALGPGPDARRGGRQAVQTVVKELEKFEKAFVKSANKAVLVNMGDGIFVTVPADEPRIDNRKCILEVGTSILPNPNGRDKAVGAAAKVTAVPGSPDVTVKKVKATVTVKPRGDWGWGQTGRSRETEYLRVNPVTIARISTTARNDQAVDGKASGGCNFSNGYLSATPQNRPGGVQMDGNGEFTIPGQPLLPPGQTGR